MYKNVGKEIKLWAETKVVILTIPAVVLGLAVFAWMARYEDGAVFGLVFCAAIILLGYFLARLICMLLYAYGELVDNSAIIRNRICGERSDDPVTTTETEESIDPIVTRNSDGSWVCPFCEHHNAANAKWCLGCKIKVSFE